MRRIRSLIAILALTAGAVVGLAGPASAAVGAEIVDISRVGCTIYVTFTVEDAAEYSVDVWDDGVLLGSVPVQAGQGATVTGEFRLMAAVLQGASGLGIVITSGGSSLDSVDPYNGADAVTDACADSGGESSGEPEISVAASGDDGRILEGTQGDFTFTRPADGSDAAMEISYAIGGDAVEGSDYEPFGDGILTFEAGVTSVTLTVSTVADEPVRADRTVTVTVVAQEGYQAGTPSEATLTIFDEVEETPPPPVVTPPSNPSPPAQPITAPARFTG